MNQSEKEGVAKDLKRLALAELTFVEAQGLAELLKTIDHSNTPIFLTNPMMAGVVVTYARNFTSSEGIGSLSSDFGRFSDSALQTAHDSIMEVRHAIYAHRDYNRLSQMEDPEDSDRLPYDVTITFHDKLSGFDFDIANPQQDPATLEAIIRLCMFQRDRVAAKLKSAINHCLLEGHDIEPGKSYKIGVNFPRIEKA